MNKLTLLLCLLAFKSSTSLNTKPQIGSRIINGEPASQGEFPWQAALFFQNATSTNFWFCSGSIISEEWILTAGHCADGAGLVFVHTGIIDISLNTPPDDLVKNFIIHEKFVHQSLANDIALVKLTKALTFNDHVHAISLSSEELPDGTEVTVSGWGQTSANDTAISPLLHYVTLVTISNDQCQKEYGTSGSILPGMVCAATSPTLQQTPCHGDSGGPVVVDFGTKPRHVATASFVSDAGCDSGRPSGYTRTAAYLDWIKEKTGI